MAKYFVFVDESGTAKQDPFFLLWCLIIPQEKIGEYNAILWRPHDFTIAKIKEKELCILSTMTDQEKIRFLSKRRNPYEMKFRNINETTLKWYEWLLSAYFKLPDVKFCCSILDRKKDWFLNSVNYLDAYMQQLSWLLSQNFQNDDIFVVLPDSITVSSDRNYEQELTEKLQQQGKQCFWVCRIESHSSIFLQTVDCLIGAVMYDNRNLPNKNKISIVNKVKEKLWVSDFKTTFTVSNPNYFSVQQIGQ